MNRRPSQGNSGRRARGPRRSGPRAPSFERPGEEPRPDPREGDARDRVHARIAGIAKQYPDLPIGSVTTTGLSGRDANFARAIEQAVLMRWNTLQAVVSSQLDRDWRRLQGSVRSALLTGTAELLLLDSVPDHAAINEAVKRVREHVHQGAAGLVNAVLRRVLELREELLPADHPAAVDFHEHRDVLPLSDGRAWRLNKPIFDEDGVVRLAQQTSHGMPLVVHWVSAHGLERTRFLCQHDLVRAPVCVTASRPESLLPLAAEDGPLRPHERHGFFVLDPERIGITSFLSEDPSRRVQDPASAEPVAATSGLRPKLIVDFCAGRGTKTRQLAEIHPDAEILATDVDARRFQDLKTLFEGHPRVRAVEAPALREAMGRTDLLVLDVPCSNTGVLARRPEARYRFDVEMLEDISTLQRRIIRDAEPLLGPEGTVLFSTCSLEPAENRRMTDWMTRRFGLEIRSEGQRFPEGVPTDPPTRIADGSYHAILARPDSGLERA